MLAASGGESGLVAPKTEATHAAQRKAIGSALSIGTTLWWLSVERGLRGWRFEGMEAREDGVWRVTGGGEGGRQSRQTVALNYHRPVLLCILRVTVLFPVYTIVELVRSTALKYCTSHIIKSPRCASCQGHC